MKNCSGWNSFSYSTVSHSAKTKKNIKNDYYNSRQVGGLPGRWAPVEGSRHY